MNDKDCPDCKESWLDENGECQNPNCDNYWLKRARDRKLGN